jgi:hypothetical protein
MPVTPTSRATTHLLARSHTAQVVREFSGARDRYEPAFEADLLIVLDTQVRLPTGEAAIG